MNTASPWQLVIVGSGNEAWMTADALAQVLSSTHCRISVLRASETGESAVYADTTDCLLPGVDVTHPALTLDESHFVPKVDGSFSFGTALSGWAQPNSSYFQPFGTAGAALGSVPFHHLVNRLRENNHSIRLANFSLATLAAQAGRFEHPNQDPRSILSTCHYGVHVNLEKLGALLKESALRRGVNLLPGELGEVTLNDGGDIKHLSSRGGERVEADFYIDCTGAAALLRGALPGPGWKSYSNDLLPDRVISAETLTALAPLPYGHAQAHDGGWIRHFPVHGKTCLSQFYSSQFMDADVAMDLLQSSEEDELINFTESEFSSGRFETPWQGNCLALGAAAGLVEPVGATQLQLFRSGVQRLLELLPGSKEFAALATEYNRRMGARLDRAQDFALLHYRLNGRRGEPFWDACRQLPVSTELQYKMDLYGARAQVPLYDEELIGEERWINLFDEHGYFPRSYSAVAKGIPVKQIETHCERVRAFMLGAVKAMPTHADYLLKLHGTMGPDKSLVESITMTLES